MFSIYININNSTLYTYINKHLDTCLYTDFNIHINSNLDQISISQLLF